jgi:lipopolysaccharide biosynthesis protein
VSKSNLEFFLKHGIIDDPNHDFIIVINGDICTANISEKKNLKIYKRINDGYDFAAWGYALDKVKFYEYDYFIFLNSTCIGPFIPRYLNDQISWAKMFTSHLDMEYKLCGPTINYLTTNKISDTPHIQSFSFGTDLIGLEILLKNNIFNPPKNIERRDVIINHEIGLSKIITDNFYKLYAFQLSETKNSKLKDKPHDDIHYVGKYYNDTINPIEVMFVKSNRINNQTIKNYIKFMS